MRKDIGGPTSFFPSVQPSRFYTNLAAVPSSLAPPKGVVVPCCPSIA